MHAWVFIADVASWYSMQKMQVCWDKSLSEPFSVSNGVRQGSVLSPHLFAVLIGCCWICVIQVLAVTGGVLLLVLLAMLMIWFYLLLVLLL